MGIADILTFDWTFAAFFRDLLSSMLISAIRGQNFRSTTTDVKIIRWHL